MNATIFREIEESLQYNDSMKLENLEPIVQLEENIENDDKLESKLKSFNNKVVRIKKRGNKKQESLKKDKIVF